MSFPYPEKPWAEGQTHEVAMGDGTYLLGQYNKAKNLWSFRRLRDDQVNRERIFTFDVYTTVSQPAPREKSPFDISDPLNMQTQQDVNWFLWQEILNLTAGNSAIWIDSIEPPKDEDGEYIFKFWWNTDENLLYFWNPVGSDGDPDTGGEWILTGAMEFDRPPIIAATAPTEHPKFPGQPLEEGDFWYSTNLLELYVWYNDAWFPSALPASGVSEEVFTYSLNRINSLIEEVYLKNIDQDNRLDVLEENIVELEEEINAIAPSNERGEWLFNPLGVASPGNYAFLDGSTQPTDRWDGASIIYVSTRDADNVTHSFNNHEAGEYLQIFNKEGDGYGLYQITDVDDNSTSPNPFFAFTVDFVQSLVTEPKAENRGRFKFFTIADGDPGAYVLKTGDEMTGNLKFKDNNQVQTRYLNSGQDSNLSIQRKGETKILVGSDNVQMQKPIKFVASSFATANEHAIHKGYVDEQIAELLAKIEELEMASGQPENYRLRLQTRNYGSNSNIGDWLEFNSCFTSVTAPSAWKNLDIDAVSGQDGYFYVCFQDDTYSLNSTGTLHVIKEFDGSYSFYDSDRHSLALTVSNAEKCPDEYSNNKNIWRCNIQPDLYRSSYNESTLGAFSDREYLYVTFAGGSLTKVTS